jgi:hypothetical protein
VLAAMVLFFVTATLFQYFSGNRNATAAVTPASQGAHPPASAAPPVTYSQGMLSSIVEVSGVRLVEGWNHKQQVAFLVVNHSGDMLSAISIRIDMRPADSAAASTTALTVNAVIRSLGAYQSREIRTDLKSDLPPSAFADWQSLRTDIQINNAE